MQIWIYDDDDLSYKEKILQTLQTVDCKPFQSLEVKIRPIVTLVDVDNSAFTDWVAYSDILF